MLQPLFSDNLQSIFFFIWSFSILNIWILIILNHALYLLSNDTFHFNFFRHSLYQIYAYNAYIRMLSIIKCYWLSFSSIFCELMTISFTIQKFWEGFIFSFSNLIMYVAGKNINLYFSICWWLGLLLLILKVWIMMMMIFENCYVDFDVGKFLWIQRTFIKT